jgi:glyoxylase-like metal-dependent hydrolase (beta-lactamase superfamily II)
MRIRQKAKGECAMSGASEVYALRYAARPDCLASEAFYRYDLYGEPDVAIGMDYFFWLIRAGDTSVVVDCGFEEGPIRNRWFDVPPSQLLARMGTHPASVEHVILTHMHFDHVGNTGLFPNATFHMTRAEFDYWTGPFRDRPAFSWPVELDEVQLLENLWRAERLHLIEDDEEVVPGVRAIRFPGHTPGQIVTDVTVGQKQIVLASDAMHYYAEVERDRPFYLFTDMELLFDSYQALRDLDSRHDVEVVPGHDPAVVARYTEAEKGCFDLTRPSQQRLRERFAEQ